MRNATATTLHEHDERDESDSLAMGARASSKSRRNDPDN